LTDGNRKRSSTSAIPTLIASVLSAVGVSRASASDATRGSLNDTRLPSTRASGLVRSGFHRRPERFELLRRKVFPSRAKFAETRSLASMVRIDIGRPSVCCASALAVLAELGPAPTKTTSHTADSRAAVISCLRRADTARIFCSTVRTVSFRRLGSTPSGTHTLRSCKRVAPMAPTLFRVRAASRRVASIASAPWRPPEESLETADPVSDA
jgi:hypothetical protein